VDGCDQALVGRARGVRAEEDQAFALLDHTRAVGELPLQGLAEPAWIAVLGRRNGRLLAQPDELGVRVQQARSGRAPFVRAGEQVLAFSASRLGAQPPGLRDELELLTVELR